MLNALTIDVEDYYHVTAFENHIDRARWSDFESRVVSSTQRLLTLFAKHEVKATFFVLGWVAEQHPRLVEQIAAEGHEIGSHSYWHRLIYQLSPAEFRSDLVRSRKLLEDLSGQPIRSFRAPTFSITGRSLWALDVLCEEGFTIDSSIFPVRRRRYGIPDAPRQIYQIQTAAGELCEFPPSVVRLAAQNLPVCGGGYFRLYPGAVTKFGLARFQQQHQSPFVFYLHPWEVDPGQPRLQIGSRMNRFRHYVNLSRTEQKLESLLRRFRFGTMSQAIAAAERTSSAPAVSSRELCAA